MHYSSTVTPRGLCRNAVYGDHMLNEQGVHRNLIELQLSHAERKTVRAAYNRARPLVERREMMQPWADYLDNLRKNAS